MASSRKRGASNYLTISTSSSLSANHDYEKNKKPKNEIVSVSLPTKKNVSLIEKFRQGDLIFGLLESIRSKWDSSIEKLGIKNYYANALNQDVVGFIIRGAETVQIEKLHNKAQDHYYALKASGRLEKPGGRPIAGEGEKNINIGFRRACKFLVENAKSSQRVHFELDMVKFDRVTQKPHDDGVTNSELRAAYRNEKKNGKNPFLLFYYQGEPCLAPWNDPEHKEKWDNYEASRSSNKPNMK